MKFYSEKQVKELLKQQRDICQCEYEKGVTNLSNSESPKLIGFKSGKVYTWRDINKIKENCYSNGYLEGHYRV
jgi:hypothetical protein